MEKETTKKDKKRPVETKRPGEKRARLDKSMEKHGEK